MTHDPDLLAILDQRLQRRAAELRAEIAAAEAAMLDAGDRERVDVIDTKELAAAQVLMEERQAEARRDADELRAVEAAQQRLRAGRYGRCADCGEPIERLRLLAQPAALRCTTCQREQERAAGRR